VTVVNDRRRIQEITDRALAGLRPSGDEIAALLAATDPDDIARVFAAARELRQRHFGDAIFLYGFVYFSTYCRNDCAFCLYRRGNAASPRYRKTADEVVAVSMELAASGVHLIDLTMGEDPVIFDSGDFSALVDLVAAVKDATGLPVMISPGLVSADVLAALRAAGADWYALYQETHQPAAYARLRMGQAFADRVEARRQAAAAGLLVEDGLLLGTGEGIDERAFSVAAMAAESCQQVRAMTFVPQEGTPLRDLSPASTTGELMAIAVMRVAMPERLIPASLDVDGIRGLVPRLDAGANVVTSIVPPAAGLAGVGQAELDIEAGLRTVSEVRARAADIGLHAAVPREYADWVERARGRARRVPA
jgi:methylornithine synthase